MLGYTFTGADSETLSLAYDKYRVKVILDKASVPTPAWRILIPGHTGLENISGDCQTAKRTLPAA